MYSSSSRFPCSIFIGDTSKLASRMIEQLVRRNQCTGNIRPCIVLSRQIFVQAAAAIDNAHRAEDPPAFGLDTLMKELRSKHIACGRSALGLTATHNSTGRGRLTTHSLMNSGADRNTIVLSVPALNIHDTYR